MFQIDISKHVEKKTGKLRKIQNAQKWSPKFWKYDFCKKRNLSWEVYSGPSTYQEFTLIYKATIAKIEFELRLAVI